MHAYLIMAHNNFQQLLQLLKCLDDERNDVYLHIDLKAKNPPLNDILNTTTKTSVIIIDRIDVIWGEYSQIECELALIKAAVNKRKYSYIHLLSGMDLPIKSQDYIHNFFDCNCGKEFIHFESKELMECDQNKVRYFFPLQKWIGNKNKSESFLYILQRFIIYTQKILNIRRHAKNSIKFFKGANWFSITGNFASYINKNQDLVKELFKWSLCCDEFFIQTLIMNSKFADNLYCSEFVNDYSSCMRLIDWQRGKPYVFTSHDYIELKDSKMLFARKFNEKIDVNIIDKLVLDVKYIN